MTITSGPFVTFDEGTNTLAPRVQAHLDGRFPRQRIARPIALGSRRAGKDAEYPTFRKHTVPILEHAQQAQASTLWLAPVDMRGFPGALDNVYVYYSTDHGGGAGCIALLTAHDFLFSNIVDRGQVYKDTSGGAFEAETPTAWRDDPKVRFLHQVNTNVTPPEAVTKLQETRMASSADGLAFVGDGTTMAQPSLMMPGDGHNGVAVVWWWGGAMYAYTLQGGSSNAACSLWTSRGGGLPGTWTVDPRRVMRNSDQICHLPGYDSTWMVNWQKANIIDWRGRPWFVGPIGSLATGGAVAPADMYTAPMTPDFRHFAAPPIKISPPLLAWENGAVPDNYGRAFEYDGQIGIPFRSGGAQGKWGLLILEQEG